MKKQRVPHDQAHTPAPQAAQCQISRAEAESSLHKASASRQQATSREPQQADKMRSAGSGSNNACPSASNKAPKEIITTVQPAGISWLAAIRGSRTRQQQAASSSNTHSKQQAGGRRPAGKRRATKNATMNGRGEHRYHALQQCAASLGGRDDPFSQSSETPFAAATLGSVACRGGSEAKGRSENLRNTSQTDPPNRFVRKLVHRPSVVLSPPIWHGQAFRQRPQATKRWMSQVAYKDLE